MRGDFHGTEVFYSGWTLQMATILAFKFKIISLVGEMKTFWCSYFLSIVSSKEAELFVNNVLWLCTFALTWCWEENALAFIAGDSSNRVGCAVRLRHSGVVNKYDHNLSGSGFQKNQKVGSTPTQRFITETARSWGLLTQTYASDVSETIPKEEEMASAEMSLQPPPPKK